MKSRADRPLPELAMQLAMLLALLLGPLAAAQGAMAGEAGLAPYKARYQVSYRGISGGVLETSLRRGTGQGQGLYESRAFPNLLARIAVSPHARQRGLMQSVLDDVHQQFIEAVAEGRELELAAAQALADGRIFTGRQAKEAKLVDELGDLEHAIQLAADLAGIDGEPKVVEPKRTVFHPRITRVQVHGSMTKIGFSPGHQHEISDGFLAVCKEWIRSIGRAKGEGHDQIADHRTGVRTSHDLDEAAGGSCRQHHI